MKELRSFDRTDCSCRVELVHQGNRLRGYVENISVSGALLHLEKESGIAPGSVCLLRFHPAKEQSLPPWELWAEAIHCSFCLIGVKFAGCDSRGEDIPTLLVQLLRGKTGTAGDALERIKDRLARYRGTP